MSVAKTVRLAELDYDPVVLAMAGQEARLGKVDDLVASITAEGVLQSLKVRTSPEADRYYVTAGLRRLTALKTLRDQGGTILGQPVTGETQVPVVYSEETDDAARRQAVAENVQRVALTVGAEVKQFAELAQHESVASIAGRFGVTEKRVRQRLKLAGVHPEILDGIDAGTLSIAAAEAFTLEEDQAKQLKHFKKGLKNSYFLYPTEIKKAFTSDLVTGGSLAGRLIGREAYAAAGGQFLDNPYAEDGDVEFWISEEVIAEQLPAAWERWKAARLEEGWLFVESREAYGEKDGERFYGRWEAGGYTWNEQERSLSGIVYDESARTAPVFGLLRPGEKKPSVAAPPVAPSLERPGHEVFSLLRAPIAPWVGERLQANSLLTLRAFVAQMHVQVFGGEDWYRKDPFEVSAQFEPPEGSSAPVQGLTFASAYEWACGQDIHGLADHLAMLLSSPSALDVEGLINGEGSLVIDELAREDGFPFDAEAYFGAIGKPLVALAYEDITGKKLKDGKLEKMAGIALTEAKAQGWLPPQLRTASYAGPCHVTPPASAEPDDDDGDDFDEDEEEFVEDQLDAAQ